MEREQTKPCNKGRLAFLSSCWFVHTRACGLWLTALWAPDPIGHLKHKWQKTDSRHSRQPSSMRDITAAQASVDSHSNTLRRVWSTVKTKLNISSGSCTVNRITKPELYNGNEWYSIVWLVKDKFFYISNITEQFNLCGIQKTGLSV